MAWTHCNTICVTIATMSNSLIHHVAIVSESSKIDFNDISIVAAAVNKQVVRDFGPAWGISATVQAFGSLEAVPSDYYQVVLVDDDKVPNAAGYHTDAHGQPLAVVEVAGNWPVTVSHEVLEMLADPSGNRIASAGPCVQMECREIGHIVPEGKRFDYLVEVCDPVESDGYTINGVPVSNFVLPCFYSSSEQICDFLGTTARLSVECGYITFRDPVDGYWYQIFRAAGTPGTVSAHRFSGVPLGCSLREQADHAARSKSGRSYQPAHMRFELQANHAARTRATIQKASLHGGASAK